jgi:hypothetical protein
MKAKYPKFSIPKTPEREAMYSSVERMLGEETLSKTIDAAFRIVIGLKARIRKFRIDDLDFIPSEYRAKFYESAITEDKNKKEI